MKEAHALASQYELALGVLPFRGLPGDAISRGVGSSVEFQDFRPYVPGDDPRHIDWNAVARTDQLIVRLHREEVRLSVDVLLDASRSFSGPKAERAATAAHLFALLGRSAGARVAVWTLGDEIDCRREDFEPMLTRLAFEGKRSLTDLLERRGLSLSPGSVRILISDFLFPHDATTLFARIGRGAGAVAFLQVLSKEERAPSGEGHFRMIDVETGEERPLVVSTASIERYAGRLRRLQEGLSSICRAHRGAFAVLPAEETVEAWCRGPLLEAGVVCSR